MKASLPRRALSPGLFAMGACLLAISCGSRSALLGAEQVSSGGGGSGGSGGVTVGGSTGVGGLLEGGSGGGIASALETCVFASACNSLSPPSSRFSAGLCLDGLARLGWWFEGPLSLPDPTFTQKLMECGQKAAPGSCDDLRSCWGDSNWYGLSRCREYAVCDGGNGGPIISYGSLVSALECTQFGAQCVDLSSNAPRACCNTEICDFTGVACDGKKATICGYWGERVDFDCAASGQTCVPGGDPFSPCKGAGACDPMLTATTCMGSVAVYCSGGGLAQMDCSNTGYRTACNEGAAPYDVPCKPQGTECDAAYDTDVCEGTSLKVCVNGTWQAVDCTKIGFSTCEFDVDTSRCAP